MLFFYFFLKYKIEKININVKVKKTINYLNYEIKLIKDWFNSEWLKRVRNVNYLDENYTKTDLDNLETIAQFTLRIVEQYKVDKANITKDGDINETKTIKELINVSYQVKSKDNKLVSKAS